MMIEPLEGRRLLTSQKVATIEVPHLYGDQPSVGEAAVYTAVYSSTMEVTGVRRTDLATGRAAEMKPPAQNRASGLGFYAAGRQFVALDEGFGWVDDASGRLVEIARNETLSGGFVGGGGRAYFATVDRLYGSETPHLWVTDGTTDGTRRLGDLAGGSADPVAFAGGRAYFTVFIGDGEQLWSAGPKGAPKLCFDSVARGLSTWFDVAQCGDRVLVNAYDEGLFSVDATGTVRRVNLGKLKDVELTRNTDIGTEPRGSFDGGGAGGAIATARAKGVGTQLYLIDADTLAFRQVSSFAYGTLDLFPSSHAKQKPLFSRFDGSASGQFNHVRATNADPRWLVSLDLRPLNTLELDRMTPATFPTRQQFVIDPRKGSMTPIALPAATTAVAATKEGTFASLVDQSVWRIDVDKPYPVAAGISRLRVAGGRVLMDGANGATFRRLRDVQAIAFGSAFRDDDGDRARDADEPPVTEVEAWVDADRDGHRDPKESHVPLSAEGNFYFDGLAAGSYDVGVDVATSYEQFRPTRGAKTIATVRVGDGATPRAARFALRSGRATINLLVFNDLDRDGRRDANEPAIEAQVQSRYPDSTQYFDVNRWYETVDESTYTPYYSQTDFTPGAFAYRVRYELADGTTRVINRTVDVRGGANRIYVPAPGAKGG